MLGRVGAFSFAGFALLGVAAADAGQFVTGEDLLQSCKSSSATEYSECVGYLMATFDFIENISQMYPQVNNSICSYPIGTEELVASFFSTMRGQQQIWAFPAVFGATIAIKENYGCR